MSIPPNTPPQVVEHAAAALPDDAEQWARATAFCVFLLAAGFTLYAVRGMSGEMKMPGGWTMSMMWMVMPGWTLWSTAAMFLGMWQAMMIAMMLPSSWPMLELYQKVAVSTGVKRPGFATVMAGYEVVHVDLGVDEKKNAGVVKQFDVTLDKGIPVLAVAESDGKLVVSQKNGEFEDARSLTPEALLEFLNKWKPAAR